MKWPRDTARKTSDAAQKGLWRLMLKLPALRGQLQIVAARSSALDELFEAYQFAEEALDHFQKERNCPKAKEYEVICSEIETDLIECLLQPRFRVSDSSGSPLG